MSIEDAVIVGKIAFFLNHMKTFPITPGDSE